MRVYNIGQSQGAADTLYAKAEFHTLLDITLCKERELVHPSSWLPGYMASSEGERSGHGTV